MTVGWRPVQLGRRLLIDCEKENQDPGLASVKSSTKAMAFGNLLFGGVIGAGVDMASGAAYDYPTMITVLMSKKSPLVRLLRICPKSRQRPPRELFQTPPQTSHQRPTCILDVTVRTGFTDPVRPIPTIRSARPVTSILGYPAPSRFRYCRLGCLPLLFRYET